MGVHVLDIEVNGEGDTLACLSPEGSVCGYRIAGPKAWGGSETIATLHVSDDDLIRYIKQYAPKVKEALAGS